MDATVNPEANEQNRLHYNQKYSKVSIKQSPLFKARVQQALRYFAPQYLRTPAQIRVLDLGGGTGEDAKAIAEMGYDVTCFDFSEVAVAKAQSLGVKAICGDFYTYPFEPMYHLVFTKTFSCLNADNVTEFRTNVERIRACLLPGGVGLYMGYTDLSGQWDSGHWYHLAADDLENFFGKGNYLILPFARKQRYLPYAVNQLISHYAGKTHFFGLSRSAIIFARLPL